MTDIAAVVADSADRADLHASVPALLIELQSQLGALAEAVTTATDRGRRPFRPIPGWDDRLGVLGYGLYLLADQSGVDLTRHIEAVALATRAAAAQRPDTAPGDWPFRPSS